MLVKTESTVRYTCSFFDDIYVESTTRISELEAQLERSLEERERAVAEAAGTSQALTRLRRSHTASEQSFLQTNQTVAQLQYYSTLKIYNNYL